MIILFIKNQENKRRLFFKVVLAGQWLSLYISLYFRLVYVYSLTIYDFKQACCVYIYELTHVTD